MTSAESEAILAVRRCVEATTATPRDQRIARAWLIAHVQKRAYVEPLRLPLVVDEEAIRAAWPRALFLPSLQAPTGLRVRLVNPDGSRRDAHIYVVKGAYEDPSENEGPLRGWWIVKREHDGREFVEPPPSLWPEPLPSQSVEVSQPLP